MILGTDFHEGIMSRQDPGLPFLWPDSMKSQDASYEWDMGECEAPIPTGPTASKVGAVHERFTQSMIMEDGQRVALTGEVDLIIGDSVVDFKVSERAGEHERYLDSMQWKAYLWLTGCTRFAYVGVHRGKIRRNNAIQVSRTRQTSFRGYEGLVEDLRELVSRIYAFLKTEGLLEAASAYYAEGIK